MESPYKEIIIALVGGGLLQGIISLGKAIGERIDAKKKEKKEEKDQHLSQAAEMKRLQSDERGKTVEELWELVEEYKGQIGKLEKKIEDLEQSQSLSRPTMTKIYTAMRNLGRQIGIVDMLLERGETVENVKKEMEILQQKFDEVDKLLP